jgi:hypothetical protein
LGGGRRTRRTKKGTNSKRINKAAPPGENFHARRLLIWTFHRVTCPARPKSELPPWPEQALRIADATTWLPSVRPERILRLPTSSRNPDPVCDPGGHLKLPHLWAGQTPPPDGVGTRDDYVV